jgi:broad specificity phosphatase PhoE
MLRIFVVRPGSTVWDEERRIKGSMDMPLTAEGQEQVDRVVAELANVRLDAIYTGPGESSKQTAKALASARKLKPVCLQTLMNLDQGLWEGKLVDEVRQTFPSLYKLGQDHPELVCAPGGETVDDALLRVREGINKVVRKRHAGNVAIVASDPLATIVRSYLEGKAFRDLWNSECDACRFEVVEISPELFRV